MSQISISHLTFSYDGSYDRIFDDVSLTLDTDWRLGFVGRNGRGKTTLLKLLLGKYEHGGKVDSGGVKFFYFPPDVADTSRLSKDILSEVSPGVEAWRLERELSLLGLDLESLTRPFDTLSNGERTKLLLAAMFCHEDGFMLIDEPTNHLDMEAREKLSAYLETKRGYILVSHDRAFLDGCVDHILSINRADIRLRQGNFSAWLEDKRKEDEREKAEDQKLRGDIKRLEVASRRTSRWSEKAESAKYDTKNSGLRPDRGYVGHKAAKVMKRAKSLEARRDGELAQKSALLRNLDEPGDLKISQIPYHSERLFRLDRVSPKYGEHIICRDISFELARGDRVALLGRNGSGKSTLLKLLCGEDIVYEGDFFRGSLTVSYIPQDTAFLRGTLSEISEKRGIDETLLKSILRNLGFERVQLEKDTAEYSDGQKKKVLIAASLCERANLCIWDEPLNFVDVISRMQIEELILKYRPTMLFVEHDRAFVQNISTKIIKL